ncbi:hypothetical protein RhiirC2_789953 [Rhizophagus irregularis]|uniref:Uncharacterized protein n=1 Tax=Rhizophagus irregularis TaxID=588596 RepID=A0A2N1MM42_9GLOM|nr:hypothetical protein RhiirC2_789953 [Rhizophagus irregularis]
MKGIKVIKATYDSEESAQKVLECQIIEDNKVRFKKDIFEQYLRSIGNVKSIKFNIKQLYYKVAVIFADSKLEEHFKKEWVIRLCKHIFRVFPSTLSREKRNHKFKYVLKLANLPSGTYNNKRPNFINKNTIMCHVCGSLFHKLRNCSENNKHQQAQHTHSVYQSIYKRYQVKAPTAKGVLIHYF